MSSFNDIFKKHKINKEQERVDNITKLRDINSSEITILENRIDIEENKIKDLKNPFVFNFVGDFNQACQRYYDLYSRILESNILIIELKKNLTTNLRYIFMKLSVALILAVFTYRAAINNPDLFEELVLAKIITTYFDNYSFLIVDYVIVEFLSIWAITSLLSNSFYKSIFMRSHKMKTISAIVFIISAGSLAFVSFIFT